MSIRPANPVRFAIAIGLLTFLLFSALVGFLAPEDFWDAISTFVATIISVIAAFFIGVGLYDRQVRRANADRRQQLNAALIAELSEIKDALKRAMIYKLPFPDRPYKDVVPITYIQPIILEDAARSGFFNSTTTEKMLVLARTIHLYNLRVSHLLSVVAPIQSIGETYQDYVRYQLDSAQRTITDLKKMVVDQSEDLIGMIQSKDHEVPDSVKEVEEAKRPWYRRLIGW